MNWGNVGIGLLLLAAAAQADDRKAWIEWLRGSFPRLRADAIAGLKGEGVDAFKDVAVLMRHPKPLVRRHAMEILGAYAAKMENVDRHKDVLLKALADTDQTVAAAAAVALARAGPKTIPKLFSRSRSKNQTVAAWAASALVASGQRAVPYLQKRLASKNKNIVLAALAQLERIGIAAAPAASAVKPHAADPRAQFRAAAYRTLGAIGTDAKATATLLLTGLDDSDPSVSYAAGTQLQRYPSEAAAALAPRLDAPNSLARDKAIYVLRRLAAGGAPALEPLLDSKRASARATAVLIFSNWGASEAARRRIDAMLTSVTPSDRAAAARYLAFRATDAEIAAVNLPALIKDKQADVADWAWFREWWFRRGGLAHRTLVVPEVIARTAGVRGYEVFNRTVRAKESDTEEALIAIYTLRSIYLAYTAGTPGQRAVRVAALPADVRKGCERGWRWLVAKQDADGLWRGGQPGTEIGVTAFALLALSAGGHRDSEGAYSTSIRKGLRALLSRMDKSGLIGNVAGPQSLLQHILATAAITDAYLLGYHPSVKAQVTRALRAMIDLRHPKGAWGYGPRDPRRNMFQTAWAAYALRLGWTAGLIRGKPFVPEILSLVSGLTDPEFGQVGYAVPGGSPARSPNLDLRTGRWMRGMPSGGHDAFPPEHSASMTSAAAWARVLLDDVHRSDDIGRAGFGIISKIEPVWDTEHGRIDLMYWLFAANAISLSSFDWPDAKKKNWHHRGTNKKDLQKWYQGGAQVLLDAQLPSGAWPEEGVWHAQGGAVYTASAALLYLLAPAQFSPDFLPSRKLGRPGAYGEIEATLRQAVKSKDARIAFAAYVATREYLPAPK